MSALDRVWFEDTFGARAARAVLAPPAVVYASVVRARAALYDRGVLAVHRAEIPVLSLGNLSVGGTGKTPVAAWAAARLGAAGAHPAVLLRGYGGDETLVHAALNPGVPVVADADRVRGVARAREMGADCVVLDDGFQHRRIARVADWVLVSAEQFDRSARLLPAGPMREPATALARATLVLVTRKSASPAAASALADRLAPLVPGGASAVCHLAPDALIDARDGSRHTLDRLRGARIVAVAAIGAPDAFFAQLRETGVQPLRPASFRDHHRFTARDVERLVHDAAGADGVVCTLKDAVKLAPLWSHAAPPLWYVSQRAEMERGSEALDASLAVVLSARAGTSSTAGAAG